MAEQAWGETGEAVQLVYDEYNLSESMASFNQQQLLTLQLTLQTKSLKKEAEISAQCTLAAKRQAEELREQRQREAEKLRLAKQKKKITIEERIRARKEMNLDELLTQVEECEFPEVRSTQNEHRSTWMKNARMLGF